MPPKGKTKAKWQQEQTLAIYASQKKQVRENTSKIEQLSNGIDSQKKQIEFLTQEKDSIDIQVKELTKELNLKKQKLYYRNRHSSELTQSIAQYEKRKAGYQLSSTTIKKRKAKPTSSSTPHTAKVIRRKETFDACTAIHGASIINKKPAAIGMIDTLTSQFKAKELSDELMHSKPSFVKVLTENIISTWSKNYYKSHDNMLRSLNIYYSHDVMGKSKYISIRKANRCSNSPNYVPYSNLAKYMNQVDIDIVRNICPDLTENVEHDEIKEGMYRPLDTYMLRIAQFYLTVNQERFDKLKVFNTFKQKDETSLLFCFAFGGDGAPLVGTVFSVSILNVGKRIASSKENFMIFGADVDETSKIVKNFVLKSISDINFLESQVFEVTINEKSFKIEFKLTEMPNDMKMLAFLAGELSNAASFFSTFANVSQNDSNDYKKKLSISGENNWNKFSFKKRLSDAALVQAKKDSLLKGKLKFSTQRSQITSYISKTLKSRQEYVPLVDKYIDVAKGEPLHLKNNTTKELFMKIFKICVAESNLNGLKNFNSIPEMELFAKFVQYVKSSMGCNCLATKMIAWFNENMGVTEREFGFRFRGKESFAYIRHFPKLIELVLQNVKTEQVRIRLHQVFYQSIHHRNIISYSVRIEDFDNFKLEELKKECHLLFKSSCVYEKKISPSLWTLCNAIPVHAEETFKSYGFGVGCNTMEGREQKHQIIKKYISNTTFQNRWPMIFRHEFIQLIHLRENNYDVKKYIKRGSKYVPELEEGLCKSCRADLLVNEVCKICDSDLMAIISKKVCSS